ncbi:LysR family transcriptional regulator [Caenimonas soli]|uniref:LysR family transcriptional regulator n=1 Tax=Caenimonas soli TaxID=2735555 RepID=UPI001552C4B8|nr:LysR family transcriptional regulator [Caenimonas soli]NPC54080.1 LysR family transcriptional regulator [Caenimonas soli]
MPDRTHIDLNSLPVFAAVAEAGGFTAAAEKLGMAKAKVSLTVARLEAQLGTSLFARTTRRVVLTEAGQALYAECVPALRGVQESLAQVGNAGNLGGVLRISAAVDYAAQSLSPALAAFAARHPGLEIDVRTSDRVADLLKEGIDLAIRLGWLRDSTLRATKLGDFEQHVLAAPAYLEAAGPIKVPADLAQHAWVALTLLPTPLTWKFASARGQTRTVRMNARLRTDSGATLRALLENGMGISVMDSLSSAQAVHDGRLVRVLPQWSLPKGGVYAVYPPGRHVPAKVRAFIDFYGAWLERA